MESTMWAGVGSWRCQFSGGEPDLDHGGRLDWIIGGQPDRWHTFILLGIRTVPIKFFTGGGFNARSKLVEMVESSGEVSNIGRLQFSKRFETDEHTHGLDRMSPFDAHPKPDSSQLTVRGSLTFFVTDKGHPSHLPRRHSTESASQQMAVNQWVGKAGSAGSQNRSAAAARTSEHRQNPQDQQQGRDDSDDKYPVPEQPISPNHAAHPNA
jgi:hypothetical protein